MQPPRAEREAVSWDGVSRPESVRSLSRSGAQPFGLMLSTPRQVATSAMFHVWQRSGKRRLVLPYYHLVGDTTPAHARHLYRGRSERDFREDLEFFARNMEPLSLEDVVDVVHGRRALGRPGFHLTFDDGFREMHDVVAPILSGMGIPATFFIATGFLDSRHMAYHNVISLVIDRILLAGRESLEMRLGAALAVPPGDVKARLLARPIDDAALARVLAVAEVDVGQYLRERRPYLSSNEVHRLVHAGFAIGSHSHDHPHYANLELTEQIAQTRRSRQMLRQRFGVKANAFAFPHSANGVPREFFEFAQSEPELDVTFGTNGMRTHWCPMHLERFSMEKKQASAQWVVMRQWVRNVMRGRLVALSRQTE